MNVRLIVGRKSKGTVAVYPLLCMDCEGDVFEWIDSYLLYDARTDGHTHESEYRCVHCGFKVRVYDGDHLLEATDDKDGWMARRHSRGSVRPPKTDPLNESVEDLSAPHEQGL